MEDGWDKRMLFHTLNTEILYLKIFTKQQKTTPNLEVRKDAL